MSTPLSDEQLRDDLIAAITADALKPRGQQVGLVKAMLAVVRPQPNRLRAERDQARAALGSIESLAERADRKGYDLDVVEILEAARAGWES